MIFDHWFKLNGLLFKQENTKVPHYFFFSYFFYPASWPIWNGDTPYLATNVLQRNAPVFFSSLRYTWGCSTCTGKNKNEIMLRLSLSWTKAKAGWGSMAKTGREIYCDRICQRTRCPPTRSSPWCSWWGWSHTRVTVFSFSDMTAWFSGRFWVSPAQPLILRVYFQG